MNFFEDYLCIISQPKTVIKNVPEAWVMKYL